MARGLDRLKAELPTSPPGQTAPEPPAIEPAEVATVTAGGADDGNALVTVTWRGGEFPAAYYAHYTPAVGHVVDVLYQGGQLKILGQTIGTP